MFLVRVTLRLHQRPKAPHLHPRARTGRKQQSKKTLQLGYGEIQSSLQHVLLLLWLVDANAHQHGLRFILHILCAEFKGRTKGKRHALLCIFRASVVLCVSMYVFYSISVAEKDCMN
jgi:hypothetical protein